jgi:hypothetical protein
LASGTAISSAMTGLNSGRVLGSGKRNEPGSDPRANAGASRLVFFYGTLNRTGRKSG